jgi:hypothetical protein
VCDTSVAILSLVDVMIVSLVVVKMGSLQCGTCSQARENEGLVRAPAHSAWTGAEVVQSLSYNE